MNRISVLKACFTMSAVFVLFFSCSLTLIPLIPANADANVHIHTDECYPGPKHTAHTDSDCHASVTNACRGTLVYAGEVTWRGKLYEKWGRCTNTKYNGIRNNYCPNYLTSTDAKYYALSNNPHSQLNYVCSYLLATSYSKNGRGEISCASSWVYDDMRATSYGTYCDCCGKKMSVISIDTGRQSSMYCRYYRCNACGEEIISRDECGSDYYSGMTHGSRTVQILTCNRELGKFYEKNADGTYKECAPCCNKTIVSLTPLDSLYTVLPGQFPVIKCRALLQNGEEVIVECMYETGTQPGMFNHEKKESVQQVRIFADVNEFWYSGCAGNPGPACCYANVSVQSNTKVCIKVSEGGSAVIYYGDDVIEIHENNEKIIYVPYSLQIRAELHPYKGYRITESEKENAVFSASDSCINIEFIPETYKVTYNGNGGRFKNNEILISNQLYNRSFGSGGFKPVNPTRSGCLFTGWFEDMECTKRVSVSGKYAFARDITLYAGWIKADNIKIANVEYDDNVPLYKPIAVRGFSYDDGFWRISEKNQNGYGSIVNSNEIYRKTEDSTYYGHWIANTYKVHFNAGIGTIPEEEKEKMVNYHGLFGDLPVANAPESLFTGWYTCDNTLDDSFRIHENSVVEEANDITLYAVYETGTDAVYGKMTALRINNEIIKAYDEKGIPVMNKGNKFDFMAEIVYADETDLPIVISIIPRYYIECDNEYMPCSVFSTSAFNGKIKAFYERGRDANENRIFETEELNEKIYISYVLPYLSYVVKEDNLAELFEYATVNTLSGREYFFEEKGRLLIVFEMTVADCSGKDLIQPQKLELLADF